MSEIEYDCEMCGKPLVNYDPKMCCSSFDCGCMGLPTNPPVCSGECWDAMLARNRCKHTADSGGGES